MFCTSRANTITNKNNNNNNNNNNSIHAHHNIATFEFDGVD